MLDIAPGRGHRLLDHSTLHERGCWLAKMEKERIADRGHLTTFTTLVVVFGVGAGAEADVVQQGIF